MVVSCSLALSTAAGYAFKAQRLRQANSRTPILMVTARDAAADVIKGLDVGADDYLTKPFDFDVLLTRLRAVSRRGPVEQLPKLKVADLTLDPATHRGSLAPASGFT